MIEILKSRGIRSLIFGVFVKTFGYLIIASGIFLAIGKTEVAIRVVYTGIIVVAVGWIAIIKALLAARGTEKIRENFKVSLSAKGGIFGLRNSIELIGRIGKVKNRFEPVKGRIKVYLDEKLIDELEVDGSFRIKLKNLKVGKHTAEVRFVEGRVNKKIRFEVVDSKTRLKSILTFASLFTIIFSLLLFCTFLALIA
ncbi:MAG: hypothetical protein QXI53_04800 [Archaeoglobaceae archaeon]|uniref:Uncharacterized protein n=1 Tax=Archaeoglobus fulgidus TaxID=2234 RepID=A0A7J3M1I0_ARCFL